MATPSVGWAAAGQNPFSSSAGPPVWLVRLNGVGSLPTCGPNPLDRSALPADVPCVDNAEGKEPFGLIAVLDPVTGTLIGWSH